MRTKHLLLTLVMLLGAVGILKAQDPVFPQSYKVTYPYASSEALINASQLKQIRVSDSWMMGLSGGITITLKEGAKATFTNLETDDVVYSTDCAIGADWMNAPEFNFNFPDLPSNGVWEFELPAGSLECSNGSFSPAYTQQWTLNDPALAANELEFTAVPAPGTELLGIKDGTTISLNFGDKMKEIAYCEMAMADVTPGLAEADKYIFPTRYAWKRINAGTANQEWVYNDDPIVFNMGGEALMKFLIGHTYKMSVKAFNKEGDGQVLIGVCSYDYKGASAPYEYASETLLSVTPTPKNYDEANPNGVTLTDINTPIVMTFSGPVNCVAAQVSLGMGAFSQMTKSSNEDKTVWSFRFAESVFVAPGQLVNVAFTGSNGNRVKGNSGEDGTSGFNLEYSIVAGGKDIKADPAGGEVEEISRIKITPAEGTDPINDSYDPTKKIYLYGEDDVQLGVFSVVPASNNSYVELAMEPAYTRAGKVRVEIPVGAFVIGSEMTAELSAALTLEYTIKAGDPTEVEDIYDYEPVKVVPANGSTIDELSKVTFTWPQESACEIYNINVYDAQNNVVATASYCDDN
ncbi:MAG: hypothetical protein NC127_09570, partial [Muribaculum sp.]|nr:hypothetical protein [Muribaculum sp.]